MKEKYSTVVDTRELKTGLIRLRFRLDKRALKVVNRAISMTGFRFPHSALEAICLSYLAGSPSSLKLDYPAQGPERFLVRLFKEQYEVVRTALDEAKKHVASDEDALLLMCKCFVAEETKNPTVEKQTTVGVENAQT